jgi:hypothetical protein
MRGQKRVSERKWVLSLSLARQEFVEILKFTSADRKSRNFYTTSDSQLPNTRLPIMKTTWKDIQPVPTSQEFLDIVLSRTQRRLPTQIRSGFQISRIRSTGWVLWRRRSMTDDSQISILVRSNLHRRPSPRSFP